MSAEKFSWHTRKLFNGVNLWNGTDNELVELAKAHSKCAHSLLGRLDRIIQIFNNNDLGAKELAEIILTQCLRKEDENNFLDLFCNTIVSDKYPLLAECPYILIIILRQLNGISDDARKARAEEIIAGVLSQGHPRTTLLEYAQSNYTAATNLLEINYLKREFAAPLAMVLIHHADREEISILQILQSIKKNLNARENRHILTMVREAILEALKTSLRMSNFPKLLDLIISMANSKESVYKELLQMILDDEQIADTLFGLARNRNSLAATLLDEDFFPDYNDPCAADLESDEENLGFHLSDDTIDFDYYEDDYFGVFQRKQAELITHYLIQQDKTSELMELNFNEKILNFALNNKFINSLLSDDHKNFNKEKLVHLVHTLKSRKFLRVFGRAIHDTGNPSIITHLLVNLKDRSHPVCFPDDYQHQQIKVIKQRLLKIKTIVTPGIEDLHFLDEIFSIVQNDSEDTATSADINNHTALYMIIFEYLLRQVRDGEICKLAEMLDGNNRLANNITKAIVSDQAVLEALQYTPGFSLFKLAQIILPKLQMLKIHSQEKPELIMNVKRLIEGKSTEFTDHSSLGLTLALNDEETAYYLANNQFFKNGTELTNHDILILINKYRDNKDLVNLIVRKYSELLRIDINGIFTLAKDNDVLLLKNQLFLNSFAEIYPAYFQQPHVIAELFELYHQHARNNKFKDEDIKRILEQFNISDENIWKQVMNIVLGQHNVIGRSKQIHTNAVNYLVSCLPEKLAFCDNSVLGNSLCAIANDINNSVLLSKLLGSLEAQGMELVKIADSVVIELLEKMLLSNLNMHFKDEEILFLIFKKVEDTQLDHSNIELLNKVLAKRGLKLEQIILQPEMQAFKKELLEKRGSTLKPIWDQLSKELQLRFQTGLIRFNSTAQSHSKSKVIDTNKPILDISDFIALSDRDLISQLLRYTQSRPDFLNFLNSYNQVISDRLFKALIKKENAAEAIEFLNRFYNWENQDGQSILSYKNRLRIALTHGRELITQCLPALICPTKDSNTDDGRRPHLNKLKAALLDEIKPLLKDDFAPKIIDIVLRFKYDKDFIAAFFIWLETAGRSFSEFLYDAKLYLIREHNKFITKKSYQILANPEEHITILSSMGASLLNVFKVHNKNLTAVKVQGNMVNIIDLYPTLIYIATYNMDLARAICDEKPFKLAQDKKALTLQQAIILADFPEKQSLINNMGRKFLNLLDKLDDDFLHDQRYLILDLIAANPHLTRAFLQAESKKLRPLQCLIFNETNAIITAIQNNISDRLLNITERLKITKKVWPLIIEKANNNTELARQVAHYVGVMSPRSLNNSDYELALGLTALGPRSAIIIYKHDNIFRKLFEDLKKDDISADHIIKHIKVIYNLQQHKLQHSNDPLFKLHEQNVKLTSSYVNQLKVVVDKAIQNNVIRVSDIITNQSLKHILDDTFIIDYIQRNNLDRDTAMQLAQSDPTLATFIIKFVNTLTPVDIATILKQHSRNDQCLVMKKLYHDELLIPNCQEGNTMPLKLAELAKQEGVREVLLSSINLANRLRIEEEEEEVQTAVAATQLAVPAAVAVTPALAATVAVAPADSVDVVSDTSASSTTAAPADMSMRPKLGFLADIQSGKARKLKHVEQTAKKPAEKATTGSSVAEQMTAFLKNPGKKRSRTRFQPKKDVTEKPLSTQSPITGISKNIATSLISNLLTIKGKYSKNKTTLNYKQQAEELYKQFNILLNELYAGDEIPSDKNISSLLLKVLDTNGLNIETQPADQDEFVTNSIPKLITHIQAHWKQKHKPRKSGSYRQSSANTTDHVVETARSRTADMQQTLTDSEVLISALARLRRVTELDPVATDNDGWSDDEEDRDESVLNSAI